MTVPLLKNISQLCSATFVTHKAMTDVNKLQPIVHLVNQLQPKDFKNINFRELPKGSPTLHYSHRKTNFFTTSIFELPLSGVMPLHDHPHMIVISKLLFGQVQVRSYDWETKTTNYPRVAKLVGERLLNPADDAIVLLPDQGNLHTFTAVTHCAFFDILAPPYTPEMPQPAGDRDCTFYKVVKKLDNERVSLMPYFPHEFEIESGGRAEE